MPIDEFKLLVLSDLHYASEAEIARGPDHELKGISSPITRKILRFVRHHIWIGDPFASRSLIERILNESIQPDLVIGLGDYGLDPEYKGVADPVVYSNVQECLALIRSKFGDRFIGLIGDHELGKKNITGEIGAMNIESWHRCIIDLSLTPFWTSKIGKWTLLGVTSSLIALPNLLRDIPPDEFPYWDRLQKEHLERIREVFASLLPDEKIILFCHDPTALGFLWEEKVVHTKLSSVALTVTGHLHSPTILTQSRLLAGMPRIKFLGHMVDRYSQALQLARRWFDFKITLCPAPFGLKLARDGGYLLITLPDNPRRQPIVQPITLKKIS